MKDHALDEAVDGKEPSPVSPVGRRFPRCFRAGASAASKWKTWKERNSTVTACDPPNLEPDPTAGSRQSRPPRHFPKKNLNSTEGRCQEASSIHILFFLICTAFFLAAKPPDHTSLIRIITNTSCTLSKPRPFETCRIHPLSRVAVSPSGDIGALSQLSTCHSTVLRRCSGTRPLGAVPFTITIQANFSPH